MRPSPTAGQASLEYVAVISLAALVLVFAAPAVGAPSVAGSVARGVRLGVCVVARDYCRAGDAEGERLPPCELSSRTQGGDDELSVGHFRMTLNDGWSVSLASDGSVTVVHTDGGGASLVAGAGLEAPFQIDVGAEASAGFRFRESVAWRFPDRASAKRFVSALPESARRERPWWRTAKPSSHAGAGAGIRIAGLDSASVTAAGELAAGMRWGPGNAATLFVELALLTPELKAVGIPLVGFGNGRLVLEYTFVDGEPRAIAFRTIIPSALGDRLTEELWQLDLRHPGNRFVAEPVLGVGMLRPPTPDYVSDLARIHRWIETEGTIERAVYAVDDASKSIGLVLKLGQELGFGHNEIRVAQRLVEARAKVPGSRVRERFDCLDQLR